MQDFIFSGNLGDLILECVWGRAPKAEILRNPRRMPGGIGTEKLNPPSFPPQHKIIPPVSPDTVSS